jgi:hypothetical protein
MAALSTPDRCCLRLPRARGWKIKSSRHGDELAKVILNSLLPGSFKRVKQGDPCP